jgi:hypothetical protein
MHYKHLLKERRYTDAVGSPYGTNDGFVYKENNIFTKLYGERSIYEKIFNMFIDKFMIHAISHVNENKIPGEENIKIIICGGKSFEFYFATHNIPDELKSFDYDLHIINYKKSNNCLLKVIKELSYQCNSMFNGSRQYKLLVYIYNKLIKEFNRQSKFIELMNINANNKNIFTYGNNLYGRGIHSVYIKIVYKFKDSIFGSLDELNYIDVIKIINGSCDDCEKQNFGIIKKNEYYSTGFGVVDLEFDDNLPILNLIHNHYRDLGNYLIKLNDDNILNYEFRKYNTEHYIGEVGKSTIYVPDFDITYFNIYFNSLIPTYKKFARNREKITYINTHILNHIKNFNLPVIEKFLYNKKINDFLKRIKNIYKPIDNKINNSNLEFEYMPKIIVNFFNENMIKFVHELIYENNLLLLSTQRDSSKDENIELYKNHYHSKFKTNNNYYIDCKIGQIICRYIYDSSSINIPLILNEHHNIELSKLGKCNKITINTINYTNQFLNIMDTYKIDNTINRELNDFYVYSVSQAYPFDDKKNCRLQVGDEYTFPSFKSTTYAKYYKDHSMFIGYDNKPFIMRIHIDPKNLNRNEFIFMGTTQYEVVLAYGSTIKITNISSCYIFYHEKQFYQNCLLIDCELLKSDIPRLQNGGKQNIYKNNNNDKSTIVPNNNNYMNNIFSNSNNTNNNTNNNGNIDIDEYIKITNEKVNKNGLIILDADIDTNTIIELDKIKQIQYKINKYTNKIQSLNL